MEIKGKNVSTQIDENLLRKIAESIESIAYGSVLITVQDSKVVQIDKNEKFRIK